MRFSGKINPNSFQDIRELKKCQGGTMFLVKMDENKCELCGATATHFCECSACQAAAGEDDHGRRPNDELGDGRWLCDVCSL